MEISWLNLPSPYGWYPSLKRETKDWLYYLARLLIFNKHTGSQHFFGQFAMSAAVIHLMCVFFLYSLAWNNTRKPTILRKTLWNDIERTLEKRRPDQLSQDYIEPLKFIIRDWYTICYLKNFVFIYCIH